MNMENLKAGNNGLQVNENTSASPERTVVTFDKDIPLTFEQRELIESAHKLKLVKNTASSLFRQGTQFQLDDLIGWGTEGLVEAAKKFEPLGNNIFSIYASRFIRARILDGIRKQVGRTKPPLSFEALPEDEDFVSQEKDPRASFIDDEEKKRKADLLKKFLAELKIDRDRQVVDMYFIQGLSPKEIAAKFGFSLARVSQITLRVIKQLREFYKKEGYEIPEE